MPTSNEIHLSTKDNGSFIQLPIGANIFISLAGNPTTGFIWAIDHIDQAITQPVQSGFKNADASAPGAGSQQYFSFKLLEKGQTKISLKYFRNWQGNSSISKTFEINVKVI